VAGKQGFRRQGNQEAGKAGIQVAGNQVAGKQVFR